eukprot:518633-Rhodomonas_salina.3
MRGAGRGGRRSVPRALRGPAGRAAHHFRLRIARLGRALRDHDADDLGTLERLGARLQTRASDSELGCAISLNQLDGGGWSSRRRGER